MIRRRLPNRRPSITERIAVGGRIFDATISFYPDTGEAAELFLAGAKPGADMGAILADASVLISIALQCGIHAAALARSMSRIPEEIDGPAVAPASVIGGALDLIAAFEAQP